MHHQGEKAISIHSEKPQKDDWTVDAEFNGKLQDDPLWGSAEELRSLLCENIQIMGGGRVSGDQENIPHMIEVMNRQNWEPEKNMSSFEDRLGKRPGRECRRE